MSVTHDIDIKFEANEVEKQSIDNWIKNVKEKIEANNEVDETVGWLIANFVFDDQIWSNEFDPDDTPTVWTHISNKGIWLAEGDEDQSGVLLGLLEAFVEGNPQILVKGTVTEYNSVSGEESIEMVTSEIGSDSLDWSE